MFYLNVFHARQVNLIFDFHMYGFHVTTKTPAATPRQVNLHVYL
jgi:hypothetical protein